jgi:hypothetical protein
MNLSRDNLFSLIETQFATKTLIERIELRLIQLDSKAVSMDLLDGIEREGALKALQAKRLQALHSLELSVDTRA